MQKQPKKLHKCLSEFFLFLNYFLLLYSGFNNNLECFIFLFLSYDFLINFLFSNVGNLTAVTSRIQINL